MISLGEEPMDHDNCPRNYLTGSSKAMEASAALELLLQLHDLGVEIEFIVSDDDSTMRAHLKHIGTHKHGKLPLHIIEPLFLCDPSHRIKVMVKDIFALALVKKRRYWPKHAKGGEIKEALKDKEIGVTSRLPGELDGIKFDLFRSKEP